MLQAATQINEMTLSFIPKIIVTVLTLMIAGPWLLQLVTNFASQLIHDIPYIVG
jgi:flagellar biosynthetic protein FliQ